jgi:hypothetical protein
VTGDIQTLTRPMTFAAIDAGSTATVNDNGSIPSSDQGKLSVDATRALSLSGGDGVDLPPGTYNFSSLKLSGGSVIRIAGPTTIYVTGNVDISGGSVSNASLLPSNLQLLVMGTTCNISGSSEMYGVVYAPGAAVVRSGSSSYYGSIIGASLDLSGSGGIHADDSLDFDYLKSGKASVRLVQ